MKQDELISVIVPVYNVEQFLPQCLNSIVTSTYRNLEIICINDASTDRSFEILKQYADKDDRFILINCLKNGGQALARNKGLDIAKGSYIAFVDSDDYIASEYFEVLHDQIKNTLSDISVCGCYIFDDHGIIQEEVIRTNKTKLAEKQWWELYRHKHTVISNCVWNKLYKADCFSGKRFIPGIIYEDTELQHKLLMGKTLSITSNRLYYYRKRDNSTTSSKQKHNWKSFLRVESLIERANYFSEKQWYRAKANTLQDAIKFLYHSIYDTDMDISKSKGKGKKLRIRIRSMMSICDWMMIRQKGQCLMILYIPDIYNALRKRQFGKRI